MPDTRTSHLNLYVIGSSSDNVGGHMITNYNYNISFLDQYIAAHDIEALTLADGTLTIAALDGTSYSVSIGDAIGEVVAGPFDPEETYTAGDLCVYNGKLYECTEGYSGAWNPAKFSQTTVADICADIRTQVDGKADMVTGATEGNLAALDASGNLTDSGIPGTLDGTPTASSPNPVQSGGVKTELDKKVDKITGGTNGNLAAIDSSGNLTDSGMSKTPDNAPTSGSSKLVKSGGVYTAVKTVQDNLDKLGLSVVDGKLCMTYSTS